jgi:DNA-binding MarR family transcriptional regulator
MTRDVQLVQTFYPQIYLACHTAHTTRRSSRAGLTPRDSSLLAHLDERRPITPSKLAAHLGVGRPALSAAVKRLVGLGFIRADKDPADGRIQQLRLARGGARAMRGSSVLEPDRVRRMLRVLNAEERQAAVQGLGLLARAARQILTEEKRD